MKNLSNFLVRVTLFVFLYWLVSPAAIRFVVMQCSSPTSQLRRRLGLVKHINISKLISICMVNNILIYFELRSFIFLPFSSTMWLTFYPVNSLSRSLQSDLTITNLMFFKMLQCNVCKAACIRINYMFIQFSLSWCTPPWQILVISEFSYGCRHLSLLTGRVKPQLA